MSKFRILTPAGPSSTTAGGGYEFEMEALEGVGAEIVECPASEEGFIAAAKGVDAVYAKGMKFTRAMIDALDECRVIALGTVGVDYVDVAAATAKGIPVTNCPDTFIEEVADHVMMLLLATHRRALVSGGRLNGYFLSTYSARKLGMQTTGNAGGSHNLVLSSRLTRQLDDLPAMLERLGTGLFVTELMGQGVNYVTGDYSRGASGFWVEGGKIRYPVEEITIAGNLPAMFRGVVAVGSDVIQRGTKRSGSILIDQMSIAGA